VRVKLLDRYLLREYLAPVFYCLAAFYMVFIVYSLFRDLPQFLESQTSFPLILRYYACQVEYVVRFILPASLFFGTLYTLWRLGRNNELTAMRASGVSFTRMMAPFLLVGAALSLASLALNETAMPAAKEWAAEFMKNRFRPLPGARTRICKFYSSAKHREWTIDRFNPDLPGELVGVKVEQERPDGTRAELITADRAEYLDEQWWFHNPKVQRFDANQDPLGAPESLAPDGYAVIEMPALTERPADFVTHSKAWEFLSTAEMIRHLAIQPEITQDLSRRRFDVQQRLALPWACLVVTLFAVPAGSRGSRRSALAGIFTAMALFGSFYAVSQVGAFLGMRGLTWPWLGAWLGNIVFSLAAVALASESR